MNITTHEDDFYLKENLRFLYRVSGLTLAEFANDYGLSASAVQAWMKGVSVPPLMKMVMISKKYGFTIDELINKPLEKSTKLILKPVD